MVGSLNFAIIPLFLVGFIIILRLILNGNHKLNPFVLMMYYMIVMMLIPIFYGFSKIILNARLSEKQCIEILDRHRNKLVKEALKEVENEDSIKYIKNVKRMIEANPCKVLCIMGMKVTYTRFSYIFTVIFGSLISPLLKVLITRIYL
jgi:hypothetical protein